MSKARSRKWFSFKGPSGERWTVYFAIRRKNPGFFSGKSVGTVWFGGRFKNRIYIDAGQKWDEIVNTLVHELMHLAFRHLRLSPVIDEAIVSDVSDDLAYILFQVMPEWPQLEDD